MIGLVEETVVLEMTYELTRIERPHSFPNSVRQGAEREANVPGRESRRLPSFERIDALTSV